MALGQVLHYACKAAYYPSIPPGPEYFPAIGRFHIKKTVIPEKEVAKVFARRVGAGEEGLVVRRLQRLEIAKIKPHISIDAVVIGTPTDTHITFMLQAVAKGKAVLCEKPIDLDMEKSLAAASEVERLGGRVMLAFNRRFLMRDGREITHPGKPGTPHHADIVAPAGPIDPDVGVLAARVPGQKGKVTGVVVHFACPRWYRLDAHPVVARDQLIRFLAQSTVLKHLPGRVLSRIASMGTLSGRPWTPFSTILEDLPYLENHVSARAGSDEDIVYAYRYPAELRHRAQLMVDGFKRAVDHVFDVRQLEPSGELNSSHVCGTCRFGDNPRTSVLDRDNRAHDLDNLYVLDGSFFPSSGGINPSLTIVANSLRATDKIARRI